MKWHYFLDISGDLVRVHPDVLASHPEDYAEGFIQHWEADESNRASLWKFCITAIVCGAKEVDVMQVALAWNLTNAEGLVFAKHMKVKLVKDSGDGPDVWTANFSDHKSEEEGRGPSALHALAALAKAGAIRAEIERKKN